ncbi:hypothetical protein F0562_002057 [Nyssa sinensis]|uniref:Uncharacterized protein n=1 Tax=Nyssa sinensis TaxID=561372 RepID=A0A5J5C4Q0_9ASTE|nr:hypothetical protein F0562_002057 [Nyssa sinensis]
MHTSSQVASRLPTLPFCTDPLQTELERLHKEREQAFKVHEDMKLLLRSECDKEIEEISTQIQSKCLDLRPSRALGAQQVVPSSFVQHLRQLSSHPTQRPSPATGSSSVGPPAATQQTTVPPSPDVHHPYPPQVSHPCHMGYRVNRHQVTCHQHLFRFPNFHPDNRPLPLSTPTYHSGPCNRAPRPEIAGGLPALHNSSSLSALELLMDVDNRPGAHQPNVPSPLPDLGSNFESLGPSEFRAVGSVGDNLDNSRVANSGVTTDVVCLSDDD